jgi:hypothetical protein
MKAFVSLIGCISVVWCASAPAITGKSEIAADFRFELSVAGPPVTVYTWKGNRCGDQYIPDAPARAFTNNLGIVHLVATSSLNWTMTGPSLRDVHMNCQSVIHGAENPDVNAADDLPWIEATYTEDGKTVYALLSNEWSGYRHHASGCLTWDSCMTYSITSAVSHDGGNIFAYTSGSHVVAAQRKEALQERQQGIGIGYATVSNIIKKDGLFYTFVEERQKSPRRSGICLIRTTDLSKAESWRAWDGQAFGVQFPNSCPPFGKEVQIRSVSWVPDWAQYVSVFSGWGRDQDRILKPGVFYSTSPDLIHWSATKLLMSIPRANECKEMYVYPSLIDDQSGSRNFESLEKQPALYLTRFNRTECKATLDRDLIRIPLKLSR